MARPSFSNGQLAGVGHTGGAAVSPMALRKMPSVIPRYHPRCGAATPNPASQEPGRVVERVLVVAVVGEPVVDKPELGVGVQDLAGEVALEQRVLVAAVGHLDGRGVVVLADHDVAR